jgi:chorismate synthase
MRIVITGPKGSGKSTLAAALATVWDCAVHDTDTLVEQLYRDQTGVARSCREIWAGDGEQAFRDLERQAVAQACADDWCIIATGGSTFLQPEARALLRENSVVVLVQAPTGVLWDRVRAQGLPAYLQGEADPEAAFAERTATVREALSFWVDRVVDTGANTPEAATESLREAVEAELALRCGVPNTYGSIVRVHTFGESHGPAIGAVVDGVPPGIPISQDTIQAQLDRRRPGQSSITTSRGEKDRVQLLSGVFEGHTTGSPIAFVIHNRDQDSSKYDNLRSIFRPGHADFTFLRKFGLRDHRGGGRSSGRETAGRVAPGALARQELAARGVTIRAHALEIGGVCANTFDPDEIENNPARCADPVAGQAMAAAILKAKEEEDSVGGIVQLEVLGLPPGLGDPVFFKLDARLAHALLSLGAVKGMEIGDGFECARRRGSQNNDSMKERQFVTNHAGGLLGGITTGAPLLVRLAVKPTASIAREQTTCDIEGRDVSIRIEGRHDPCIVPRIIPVMENMAALVLWDAWLLQERLRPEWAGELRQRGW